MQKGRNDLQKSGIFNSDNLNIIKREGKPNIFSKHLHKNLVTYLYDFFYYRELSDICCTNIYLYNCFCEYEMSNWKMEMQNIINIFNLDIKDPKNEIDDTLNTCIKKKRIYPFKDYKENYLRIDKEGINLISLAYYDPDMQALLGIDNEININNKNNNIKNIRNNGFNFEKDDSIDIDNSFGSLGDFDDENNIKTPWIPLHSKYSYISEPGNIIFLEDKCPLDFGFSFHHVIKSDYKFYLHHSMIDMRNAKLRLQIIINDEVVFEAVDFPSKKILEQSTIKNKTNELYDVYICDINKHMFDAVKNSLKSSIDSKFSLKDSFKSDKSTENSSINLNSTKSIQSLDSSKFQDNKISFDLSKWNNKDYTVRIRFTNQHLFWKAGWYLDGGRLVRSVYKIEK